MTERTEETDASDDGRGSYEKEWSFESEMPIWTGDGATEAKPVEMAVAMVERVWTKVGEVQEGGKAEL